MPVFLHYAAESIRVDFREIPVDPMPCSGRLLASYILCYWIALGTVAWAHPTTPLSKCAVTGGASTTVADVQSMVNQVLGQSPPSNDLNYDNVVNVADIQLVVNAVLNLGCSAPTGPPPVISDFNPKSGPAGTLVTVTGGNFGTPQASLPGQIGGTVSLPVSSMTPTSLVIVIPSGAASGAIAIGNGNDATSTATAFTVTLVGGSGGAGGQIGGGTAGGNAGAGGGAIRIVSSTSITIAGSIGANGGSAACGVNGYCGGAGSGGVVHLIAPTVAMNGGIGAAIFKASANTFTNTGNIFATSFIGGLYNPPLPIGVPKVQVVSVDNAAAPSDVQASVLAPDFTVNTTSSVSVNITAQYIPVGTVVKLYLTSEQGNDSTVTCAPLAGTLASSTATCTAANYPQGITITDIREVW